MAREDRQDRETERSHAGRDRRDFGQADYSGDYAYDPRHRSGYRAERDIRSDQEDFGQADYSRDYAYDPDGRRAVRRDADTDRDHRRNGDFDDRRGESRSWVDRAGDFLSGQHQPVETRPPRGRRGPSDRVLWAVIVERLEDERGLDLRDLDVIVENAEVTLNGTVRHKADKRRIEDVADIDGIRHVQNNLRVRDHRHWTFF
jgi:BON domain-containing protein